MIVLPPMKMTKAFTDVSTGDLISDFAMILAATAFFSLGTTPRMSKIPAPSFTAMTSILPIFSR